MSSEIPTLIASNWKRGKMLITAYERSLAMARDIGASNVAENDLLALAQTYFKNARHLSADALQAQSSVLLAQAMEKIIHAQMHRLQLHRAFPTINKLRILFDGHARSSGASNPEKEHDLKAQTLHERLLISISYLDNALGKRTDYIDQVDNILAKAPPRTIDDIGTAKEAGELIAHYYLKLSQDRHIELEQGLRWSDIGLSSTYLRTTFRAKASPMPPSNGELAFNSTAILMHLHDMPDLLSAAERDLVAARVAYQAPEDALMDFTPFSSSAPVSRIVLN